MDSDLDLSTQRRTANNFTDGLAAFDPNFSSSRRNSGLPHSTMNAATAAAAFQRPIWTDPSTFTHTHTLAERNGVVGSHVSHSRALGQNTAGQKLASSANHTASSPPNTISPTPPTRTGTKEGKTTSNQTVLIDAQSRPGHEVYNASAGAGYYGPFITHGVYQSNFSAGHTAFRHSGTNSGGAMFDGLRGVQNRPNPAWNASALVLGNGANPNASANAIGKRQRSSNPALDHPFMSGAGSPPSPNTQQPNLYQHTQLPDYLQPSYNQQQRLNSQQLTIGRQNQSGRAGPTEDLAIHTQANAPGSGIDTSPLEARGPSQELDNSMTRNGDHAIDPVGENGNAVTAAATTASLEQHYFPSVLNRGYPSTELAVRSGVGLQPHQHKFGHQLQAHSNGIDYPVHIELDSYPSTTLGHQPHFTSPGPFDTGFPSQWSNLASASGASPTGFGHKTDMVQSPPFPSAAALASGQWNRPVSDPVADGFAGCGVARSPPWVTHAASSNSPVMMPNSDGAADIRPRKKGRRLPTSHEVFLKYVDHITQPDGAVIIDTSRMLSRECYIEWLHTRRKHPRSPEECFRKAILSHVTVSDRASLAFPAPIEASLLVELRKQRVWPCFDGHVYPESQKAINIGLKGLRAQGYHERMKNTSEQPPRRKRPSKSKAATAAAAAAATSAGTSATNASAAASPDSSSPSPASAPSSAIPTAIAPPHVSLSVNPSKRQRE